MLLCGSLHNSVFQNTGNENNELSDKSKQKFEKTKNDELIIQICLTLLAGWGKQVLKN